jgi:hypothetical protein
LFPGRLDNQIADFGDEEREWSVDKIVGHKGVRSDAVFEVKWKSGDLTWLPFDQVDHLDALKEYFNVLGIETVAELTAGIGEPPTDDPQVFLGHLSISILPFHLTPMSVVITPTYGLVHIIAIITLLIVPLWLPHLFQNFNTSVTRFTPYRAFILKKH